MQKHFEVFRVACFSTFIHTLLLFVARDKGEKTFANANVALSSFGLQQNC